jgi:hypothetical protein
MPGYHSAAALADHLVAKVRASACSDEATPQAAAEAPRRAQRY